MDLNSKPKFCVISVLNKWNQLNETMSIYSEKVISTTL